MADLHGYVTDIPYVRGFKPMLAPAWLDLVALLGGWVPPAREDGFAWCDLGCGQGVTDVVLAATHPGGNFHAIDAMPVHIDHGWRLADAAGIANLRFEAADFDAAVALDLPQFDYIVAHGVYSWVDRETRAALRRFVDRHLKPGGLVYVSYNALPGWLRDLPFQHLVRELASAQTGDSGARFSAAAAIVARLAAAGIPALAASPIVRELARRPQDYPSGYLVHEFLHRGWQPLYVGEVRQDLAAIGLVPVGSTTLVENFDRWVVGKTGHRLLKTIAEPDLRELVRDFLIDQRLRCDVFTRGARPLSPAEQRRRLSATSFALMRPPDAVSYRTATPAGELRYDNTAARAIVASLAGGPAPLDAIKGIAPADLLANALVLAAAGDLRPVEAERAPVAALNEALRRRLGTQEEIPLVVLPCGTALEIGPDLPADFGDGKFAGWSTLMEGHGV